MASTSGGGGLGGTKRAWLLALVAGALVLAVCIGVVAAWQRRRGRASVRPRGAPALRLVLRNTGAASLNDVTVIERRLRAAGADPEVTRATGTEFALTMYTVPGEPGNTMPSLGAILAPRELRLCFVADDQTGLELPPGGAPPAGITLRDTTVMVGRDASGGNTYRHYQMYTAATARDLAPLVAGLPPRSDRTVATECPTPRDARTPAYCWAWWLELPAVIGNGDIAHAEVQMDEERNEPRVALTLAPAAAARFEQATGQNLGRRLAIVVDGEILSMPVIQTPIPGGHVQITMGGGGSSVRERFVEAQRLAGALESGLVHGRWELESIERAR